MSLGITIPSGDGSRDEEVSHTLRLLEIAHRDRLGDVHLLHHRFGRRLVVRAGAIAAVATMSASAMVATLGSR